MPLEEASTFEFIWCSLWKPGDSNFWVKIGFALERSKMSFPPAGAKRRSQVTGYRKCNKKVRHPAGPFMFIYLFHSGYVIVRHMFGIDHALPLF